MATSNAQVRVVVRVRPFLASETGSNGECPIPCVSALDAEERRSGGEITVHIKDQYSSRSECYKLDSFFAGEDDLRPIFIREVSAVMPGIFQGLNATIFAYGATGSGKTYTMQGNDDNPGLIPLTLTTVFDMSQSSDSSVEISYYEVYMDRCYDLLEPKAKEVMVLEDKDGKTQLRGLSRVPVHSMREFVEAFTCGVQRRKVAHTGLNDVSSRSHGVLSVIVSKGSVTGKLNLIDLAGNEDNRRTCNEGIRLQESAKINQSLFALSNVIYALNNNESRVPYRESKLTRILQDSLGGTSGSLMIACLNPGSYSEAVHTVSLAARSRHIHNYAPGSNQETPRVKVDMEAKLRAWLESKGKTRSIQRINGSCSPFPGKTSSSVSSRRRPEAITSSSKFNKSSNQAVHKWSVPRKLFESAAPAAANSLEEENMLPKEEIMTSIDGTKDDEEHMLPREEISTSIDGSIDNEEYILPREEITRSIDGLLNSKGCECTGLVKSQESSSCNQQTNKDAEDSAKDAKENLPSTNDPASSRGQLRIQSKTGESPIRDLQRSLRKVLCPVNSNITPVKELASDERLCIILVEPKTPKTRAVSSFDPEQVIGTPLEKFSALGSNLKEFLAKEYLAFLNVASKEELLSLKGIGEKRAEYILQLREDSPQPLKSLSDLEKIGLSSKQVHNMFKGAARGIFC